MARLLDLEYEDPHYNLAVEEAISIAVGEGISPETLRFWRNANTVVIGRFQCASLEVDFRRCLEHGVQVSRRFTGGGAVYHDYGNLNYALSLRRDNPLVGEKLFKAFELVGKGVAIGLIELGVKESTFRPINDVQIGDRKVSGMAGLIARDYIFVHGSILISSNLEILAQVLNVPQEKLRDKFVRSVRQRVVTIEEALGRKTGIPETKDAMRKGLEGIFGVEFEGGGLLEEEEELAKELFERKYSTLEWSLGPCKGCPRRTRDELIFKKLAEVIG